MRDPSAPLLFLPPKGQTAEFLRVRLDVLFRREIPYDGCHGFARKCVGGGLGAVRVRVPKMKSFARMRRCMRPKSSLTDGGVPRDDIASVGELD